MPKGVNKPKKAVKTCGRQAEIARKTGKSRALITRKAKQGKLVEKDGELDVEASVQAIMEDVSTTCETYAEAQRRKEVALADLRELELAQKSGQLIEVSGAALFLANASKAVTNQLLALPDKLAPLIAAVTDIRECRDMLLKEIKQALENLPEKIPVPEAA